MKILIAPDKFKGSLTASEVAEAVAKGIRRFDPSIDCILHPLADGGDGSLSILGAYLDLEKITLEVSGPLGDSVIAAYFRSGKTAFVELADAAGLVLLAPEKRNPLLTTTFGVGQLMHHAIQNGAREIYLFLGGSATNDGGAGIAQALGFQFLDKKGETVFPIGKNLIEIDQIIAPTDKVLEGVLFYCLCDVQNPLLGKSGASHVYAAQKGASSKDITMLEAGMQQFAKAIEKHTTIDVSTLPGGGAAGGVAAGMSGLLGAEIKSGIDTFLTLTHFEEQVKNADLIISGEGKLDSQTLEGKVINGVMNISQKHQKPLLLVVGQSELDKETLADEGILDVLTVMSRCASVGEAVAHAGNIIEMLVFDYFNASTTA
ncbi:MAG: glycerate kinase [Saprospiraceae bacterium]